MLLNLPLFFFVDSPGKDKQPQRPPPPPYWILGLNLAARGSPVLTFCPGSRKELDSFRRLGSLLYKTCLFWPSLTGSLARCRQAEATGRKHADAPAPRNKQLNGKMCPGICFGLQKSHAIQTKHVMPLREGYPFKLNVISFLETQHFGKIQFGSTEIVSDATRFTLGEKRQQKGSRNPPLYVLSL